MIRACPLTGGTGDALKDPRVLLVACDLEVVSQVTSSLLQVRGQLTETLQALPENVEAACSLRAMRAACRKFLEERHPEFCNLLARDRTGQIREDEGSPGFFAALGKMRATFGTHIAALAYQYNIDVEPELASILLPRDTES